MTRFDAIVLGLGAMGSAAAYQLAKRGSNVLGLDQFAPPHSQGSSHGDTRITRLAIGEGAHYTPLALRSHELWRQIERETGARLLEQTGALIISSAAKTSFTHVEGFFDNTIAAARKYGIAHELLDAAEIRRRYPPFKVVDDEVGYFEKDAGFLRPEACVRSQLALARNHGAQIHTEERAIAFDSSASGVTVTTSRARYAAERLILTAGPWLPQLLGGKLATYLRVFRQVLLWFDVDGDVSAFLPERFPVFIWELKGMPQGVYGFPALDGVRGGVKVATEHFGASTDPAQVDRGVAPGEVAATYRDYVRPYLAALSSRCLKAVTCLYTVTPDFGFLLDAHPESERVLIVSACSGHGFKHSPAIGEAVAELIVDGASRLDLSGFEAERFARGAR
jgi:sarcosine oxidase